MLNRIVSPLFWLLCLFLLAGCPAKPPQPPEPAREVFEAIQARDLPDLSDDESVDGLRSAVSTSIQWYGKLPVGRTFSLGSRTVSAAALKESLIHFLGLLDSGDLNPGSIARDFDLFRVVPAERSGRMLVTGYYEPVLEGSLERGGPYRYPLYGVPPELVTIDLERFDLERFRGERLIGRLEKGRVVPFYTRSEIDGRKKLEPSGGQLVWLKDPVDCFFLHIQGSGLIILPNGAQLRVGYAGANGRPYLGIGKKLIDRGEIPREDMSLQAIRAWLKAHPESRDQLMWENESYVFFRFVSRGPVGSLDSVLTPGRSVASDPKFHPRGALAFLVSEKPRFDSTGRIAGWDRLSRWVLNQDTGGAIKGAGRIDLFCGTGSGAEEVAGPMKQPGEMYYFLRKGLD